MWVAYVSSVSATNCFAATPSTVLLRGQAIVWALHCRIPPTITCSTPGHAFAAGTWSPSQGHPWLWGHESGSMWHRRASGWWEHEQRSRGRWQESGWREGRWTRTQEREYGDWRSFNKSRRYHLVGLSIWKKASSWTYPVHGSKISICLNFFKDGQHNLYLSYCFLLTTSLI